jgi:hypothetical protein
MLYIMRVYGIYILDFEKSFRIPWRNGADGVRWKLQKPNIRFFLYTRGRIIILYSILYSVNI